VGLFSRRGEPSTTTPIGGTRGAVFTVQLFYLGGLGALAALYFTDVITPRHFIGSVPIGAPWFGALGAVLISLSGVFEHIATWLPSYRFWHWSRPLIGAAVGIVAILIFQAGILAVGENVKPTGTNTSKNVLYYLIAFLVGYREEAFRTLIKRLGDVVLPPAGAVGGIPTISSITPARAPIGGGTDVVVTGTGLSTIQSVKFGETEATDFGPIFDVRFSVKAPPTTSPGDTTLLATFRDGSRIVRPFTYKSEPVVTGVDPPSGPERAEVVITGTGLSGATAVHFGGASVGPTAVGSDEKITARSPPGSGEVHVRVETPAGTSAESDADLFTYEGD
jgi:IPT/TIG domain